MILTVFYINYTRKCTQIGCVRYFACAIFCVCIILIMERLCTHYFFPVCVIMICIIINYIVIDIAINYVSILGCPKTFNGFLKTATEST